MISYSIIIPHRNIPILLRRCLASIPRREDIEIIVVDDGSNLDLITEETFNDFISQTSIRLILLKEHLGVSHCRNVGLNYARGKWIYFVDADDFFMPNAIEMLGRYRDSNADVICFHTCAKNSETLENSLRGIAYNNLIDTAASGEISLNFMLAFLHTTWSKMVKRSFLFDNKIFFQEDTLIWTDMYWSKLLAIYAQKVDISSDILYCVTDRNTSMTRVCTSEFDLGQMYHVIRCINKLICRYAVWEYAEDITKIYWKIRENSISVYWKYFFLSLFDGTFYYCNKKNSTKINIFRFLQGVYWLFPKKMDYASFQ